MGLRAIKEKSGLALAGACLGQVDSMSKERHCRGLLTHRPCGDLPGRSSTILRQLLFRQKISLEEKTIVPWRKSYFLLRAKTAMTFPCIRRTPFTADRAAHEHSNQIEKIGDYGSLSSGEYPGVEFFQGTLIRSDQLFPRRGGMGANCGKKIIRRCSRNILKRDAACLVGRSVRPGRRLISLAIAFKEALEKSSPRRILLCISFPPIWPGDDRQARQGVYPRASRGRIFRAPEAVFFSRKRTATDRQGDTGDGYLRHAKRHHGPAFTKLISSPAATF